MWKEGSRKTRDGSAPTPFASPETQTTLPPRCYRLNADGCLTPSSWPGGLIRHVRSVLETGDLLEYDCEKEGGSKTLKLPPASSAEQSSWRWDHPGTPRMDAAPQATTLYCWPRSFSGVFLFSTFLSSSLSWTVSNLPQCMTGTKKQSYFWQTHLSHSPRAGGCSKRVIYLKSLSESESRSVMSNSLPSRGVNSPWNSPGQNTGVVPPPGGLPNPGIEPRSPELQADSLPAEPL